MNKEQEKRMKNFTLKKQNEIKMAMPDKETIESVCTILKIKIYRQGGGGINSNKDLYGQILKHDKYEEVKEKLESSIKQKKKELSEKQKKKGRIFQRIQI